jgi:hypothetical protein
MFGRFPFRRGRPDIGDSKEAPVLPVAIAASILWMPLIAARFQGQAALVACLADLFCAVGFAFAVQLVVRKAKWYWLAKRPIVKTLELECLSKCLRMTFGLMVCWLALNGLLVLYPQTMVFSVPAIAPFSIAMAVAATVINGYTNAAARQAGKKFVSESLKRHRVSRSLNGAIRTLRGAPGIDRARGILSIPDLEPAASGVTLFLISAALILSFEGGLSLFAPTGYAFVRQHVHVHLPWVNDDSAEAGELTYEDVCPESPNPGSGAPRPWSELIYSLVLGPGGDGAIQTGCIAKPYRAPANPHMILAPGYCDGSLRSLLAVAPHRTGSILYQQAARFARSRQDNLLAASSRIKVGGGDFYLLRFQAGTYVLVRPRLSSGSAGADGQPTSCDEYTSENYPYVVVPPGLVRIWMEIARDGWVWPTLDSSEDQSGAKEFVFLQDSTNEIVAHAICFTPESCSASLMGYPMNTSGGLNISIDEIRAYAPPPIG